MEYTPRDLNLFNESNIIVRSGTHHPDHKKSSLWVDIKQVYDTWTANRKKDRSAIEAKNNIQRRITAMVFDAHNELDSMKHQTIMKGMVEFEGYYDQGIHCIGHGDESFNIAKILGGKALLKLWKDMIPEWVPHFSKPKIQLFYPVVEDVITILEWSNQTPYAEEFFESEKMDLFSLASISRHLDLSNQSIDITYIKTKLIIKNMPLDKWKGSFHVKVLDDAYVRLKEWQRKSCGETNSPIIIQTLCNTWRECYLGIVNNKKWDAFTKNSFTPKNLTREELVGSLMFVKYENDNPADRMAMDLIIEVFMSLLDEQNKGDSDEWMYNEASMKALCAFAREEAMSDSKSLVVPKNTWETLLESSKKVVEMMHDPKNRTHLKNWPWFFDPKKPFYTGLLLASSALMKAHHEEKFLSSQELKDIEAFGSSLDEIMMSMYSERGHGWNIMELTPEEIHVKYEKKLERFLPMWVKSSTSYRVWASKHQFDAMYDSVNDAFIVLYNDVVHERRITYERMRDADKFKKGVVSFIY